MATFDPLQTNVDQLRTSVSSIEELRLWLTAHPQYLFGDAVLTDVDSVALLLKADKEQMLYSDELGGLRVSFTYTATTPYSAPLLDSLCAVNSTQVKLDYHRSGTLLFKLHEWPFACALVAGTCIEAVANLNMPKVDANMAHFIDTALSYHFKGMTMQKLLDLVHADMVPISDEFIRAEDITKVLFASREIGSSTTLPNLLTT